MSQTIVLISGANRGLGKGLLELYLTRPNHIVIAANRDTNHTTSRSLINLPTAPGSRLITVQIDASNESDALEAVRQLSAQGTDHIDIVIANAGISYIWRRVSDLKISDLQAHVVTNVYGVVWLYQATLPLLLKSKNPKWVTIGTAAGWLEHTEHRRLQQIADQAHERRRGKLTAFLLSPGWSQTDMGNTGARAFGMDKAPVTVQDSCTGMIQVIDEATKEEYGGKMWAHRGETMRW